MMHWFRYLCIVVFLVSITHAIIFMYAGKWLRKVGFYLQNRMLRKYNQLVTDVPWYARYTDWITRSKPLEPFESEFLDMVDPIIKEEKGDEAKWVQ